MKTLKSLSFCLLFIYMGINSFGQIQLDVQGNNQSGSTVAKIEVNYQDNYDVIGLYVKSQPSGVYGIGGHFFGGFRGIIGESIGWTGVFGTSTTGYGLQAYSQTNYGLFAQSGNDYGIYGTGSSGVRGVGTTGNGVYGSSTSLNGVYGVSVNHMGVNGKSTNQYGVVGISDNSYGVYGSGDDADFWAANGNYGNSSSKRWKSNVVNISDPLEKLSKLRGIYFDWDQEHGGKHAVGFIAEEVGLVLPEVVIYEDNGIDAKGMDYSKITPLLVEAANAMRQEYQDKFDQQQSEIDALRLEMVELTAILKKQAKNASED